MHPRVSQLILTNGTDWGLNGTTYESSLKDGDDLSFTISDNTTSNPATLLDEENTASPLTDLEWTPDDKYPPEYIKQLNQWAGKGSGSMPNISESPLPTSPPPQPTASPVPNSWTYSFQGFNGEVPRGNFAFTILPGKYNGNYAKRSLYGMRRRIVGPLIPPLPRIKPGKVSLSPPS